MGLSDATPDFAHIVSERSARVDWQKRVDEIRHHEVARIRGFRARAACSGSVSYTALPRGGEV